MVQSKIYLTFISYKLNWIFYTAINEFNFHSVFSEQSSSWTLPQRHTAIPNLVSGHCPLVHKQPLTVKRS